MSVGEAPGRRTEPRRLRRRGTTGPTNRDRPRRSAAARRFIHRRRDGVRDRALVDAVHIETDRLARRVEHTGDERPRADGKRIDGHCGTTVGVPEEVAGRRDVKPKRAIRGEQGVATVIDAPMSFHFGERGRGPRPSASTYTQPATVNEPATATDGSLGTAPDRRRRRSQRAIDPAVAGPGAAAQGTVEVRGDVDRVPVGRPPSDRPRRARRMHGPRPRASRAGRGGGCHGRRRDGPTRWCVE